MINGAISYFLTFVSLLFFGAPMTAPIVDSAVDAPQPETVQSQPATINTESPTTAAPTITTIEFPTVATETISSTINPDTLASCLTERGAKFYGAYWCSHCAAEKELFGEAIAKVNYVECDAGGSNGNPQACIDAGIKAYPTWQMPGKADQVGAQGLEALATWSSCPTN